MTQTQNQEQQEKIRMPRKSWMSSLLMIIAEAAETSEDYLADYVLRQHFVRRRLAVAHRRDHDAGERIGELDVHILRREMRQAVVDVHVVEGDLDRSSRERHVLAVGRNLVLPVLRLEIALSFAE